MKKKPTKKSFGKETIAALREGLDDMKKGKLKPTKVRATKPRSCPFCGREPVFDWQKIDGVRFVVVYCSKSAIASLSRDHYSQAWARTRAAAIAAWNGEKK